MDEFGRKTFYVDFSGYCEIQATDADTAREIFWQMVGTDQPLPSNLYEVETVEEKKEPSIEALDGVMRAIERAQHYFKEFEGS